VKPAARGPRRLLAAVLSLACAAAAAREAVDVELHAADAASLLPVLRALAAPAHIEAAGAGLQVRAAAPDLARVQRLVRLADHPPRTLAVLWRQDPPPPDGPQAAGGAPADDNSTTLSTGGALPPDRHGNARVLGTRTSPRPDGVREGDALQLPMTVTQSLRFRAAPAGSSAARQVGGLVYFDAVTEVDARVWVVGDAVAVQVQPRLDGRVGAGPPAQADPGPLVVIGRLGRWFALADGGDAPAGRLGLWLKVELAAP
jgi:hypothetical protein